MHNASIIFDVDGVLLELTSDEEDLFFEPFRKFQRPDLISYDWNSYRIRNEEDILAELAETHGLPSLQVGELKQEYLALVAKRKLPSIEIFGAKKLLQSCAKFANLGIATANFRQAAKLRLERSQLWNYVQHAAFGADGGGHKTEILSRAIATLQTPPYKIIYIGDNLNDVEAGVKNKVHFIGFSEDPERLKSLKNAGALHLSQNHVTTLQIVRDILAL